MYLGVQEARSALSYRFALKKEWQTVIHAELDNGQVFMRMHTLPCSCLPLVNRGLCSFLLLFVYKWNTHWVPPCMRAHIPVGVYEDLFLRWSVCESVIITCVQLLFTSHHDLVQSWVENHLLAAQMTQPLPVLRASRGVRSYSTNHRSYWFPA